MWIRESLIGLRTTFSYATERTPIMLSRLSLWLGLSGPSTPQPTGSIARVVRIPADGSAPHMLSLHTIDIASEDNLDCFFGHIPDFRGFWGQEGFTSRDMASYSAFDESPPELNGYYMGFKRLAKDHLPLSKHTGFCGDAFVFKMKAREWTPGDYMEEKDDEGRLLFDDIPDGFLESAVLKRALNRLREASMLG